jgi:hypothetical protein
MPQKPPGWEGLAKTKNNLHLVLLGKAPCRFWRAFKALIP